MITNVSENKIEICIDDEYYIYTYKNFNNYYKNVNKRFYKGKIDSDIYGIIWVDQYELIDKLTAIIKAYFRKQKFNQILSI
jgi:hypothetical protein